MSQHLYRYRSFPKLLSILYSRIFRHNELRCMPKISAASALFPFAASSALRICSSSARGLASAGGGGMPFSPERRISNGKCLLSNKFLSASINACSIAFSGLIRRLPRSISPNVRNNKPGNEKALESPHG